MPISLFSRDFIQEGNSGENIIVLHGLFGSSKNWLSFARSVSDSHNVYLLDLRNHGDSPHSSSHSLQDIVEDLAFFIQSKNISEPVLLGHSMGGLAAMLYVLQEKQKSYPKCKKLIVQDIAPREYPFEYTKEVKAMQIDVSGCKSRQEVDTLMAPLVPDPFIRQFLQMNLERKGDGGYYWKLNLRAIASSQKLFGNVFSNLSPVSIPALFILGGKSPYILPGDTDRILSLFPSAQIHTIPEGGHYMQYTHPEEFRSLILDFLSK